MAEVPDGIFDMVRAICTLSGLKVMFDTAYMSFNDLYTDPCPECFGHGTMTCKMCKGCKTLRSRPERLVRNSKGKKMLLHLASEVNECWACGPLSPLDFDLSSEDVNDDTAALRIMDNFSASMAGRKLPYPFPPMAGTVPCGLCMGGRVVHRHTPNIEKVFGLGDDIWTQVEGKEGFETHAFTDRSRFKPRRVAAYLEYPKHPPRLPKHMIEAPVKRVHPILVPQAPDKLPTDEEELTRLNDELKDVPNPWTYVLPLLDTPSKLGQLDSKAFP